MFYFNDLLWCPKSLLNLMFTLLVLALSGFDLNNCWKKDIKSNANIKHTSKYKANPISGHEHLCFPLSVSCITSVSCFRVYLKQTATEGYMLKGLLKNKCKTKDKVWLGFQTSRYISTLDIDSFITSTCLWHTLTNYATNTESTCYIPRFVYIVYQN